LSLLQLFPLLQQLVLEHDDEQLLKQADEEQELINKEKLNNDINKKVFFIINSYFLAEQGLPS